jgi:hypothetical protein
MKHIRTLLVVGIVFSICVSSCKDNDSEKEARKIIVEWVGKTIEFPSNMTMSVYGKDTLFSDFQSTPYKILLYVDSTGCTSCKLKLQEWKKLINEADTSISNLSFVFCFQPKNTKELTFLFRSDRFDYPVFIDTYNELNKINKFPKKLSINVFYLMQIIK